MTGRCHSKRARRLVPTSTRVSEQICGGVSEQVLRRACRPSAAGVVRTGGGAGAACTDHQCYEVNVSPKDQSESLIFFKGRSRGLGLAGARDTKNAHPKTLGLFPPGASRETRIFSCLSFNGALISPATQSQGRDKSGRSAGGAGKRAGGRAKGGNTAATL